MVEGGVVLTLLRNKDAKTQRRRTQETHQHARSKSQHHLSTMEVTATPPSNPYTSTVRAHKDLTPAGMMLLEHHIITIFDNVVVLHLALDPQNIYFSLDWHEILKLVYKVSGMYFVRLLSKYNFDTQSRLS